ncbi:MAG: hypothetical protein J6S63_01600 [Atopobiaceae bacterium]|nr:hypothetical protein [Atopobiaceae bacterium]
MPTDKRHTVEGYWDCQYCGRTGIRGRFKSCPGCGHGRDASVRFYTKEIDAAHAISHEEFRRQTAEADKNSRSDSANYTQAHDADASEPSLYARAAGEGRGDAYEAQDKSDWYCDFCDSYNPATTDVCRNCGASRESTSGETYEQRMGAVARTYDSHGNLVSERDLSKRTKKEPSASRPAPAVAPKSGPGCLRFVIVGGLVVALVALLMFVFGSRPRKITVDGFDWERTISIEQLQTVDESGWELPKEARLDHKTQEIRSYNHVLDHYEEVPYEVSEEVLDHYETYTTEVDNGDGTFDVEEHQEPVYKTEYHTEYRDEPVYVDVPIFDTKYYYKIERWVPERDVTTSGDGQEPYWGEVELSKATGDHGTGEEREGTRFGTYGVTDSEGNHYTADEDYWTSLKKGDTLTVNVDGNKHITPAD